MKKLLIYILFVFNWITVFGQKDSIRLGLPLGHTLRVNSAIFSPDGKTIVTASEDLTAKVWDWKIGRLLQSMEGHTREVNFATFSPDGKTIATLSDDLTTILWDVEEGKLLYKLGGITSANFSPDGKYLLGAGVDNMAYIWDWESKKLFKSIDCQAGII